MANFRFTGYPWDEKLEEEAQYQHSKLMTSMKYNRQLDMDQGYLYAAGCRTPMCYLASDMIEAGLITPARRLDNE